MLYSSSCNVSIYSKTGIKLNGYCLILQNCGGQAVRLSHCQWTIQMLINEYEVRWSEAQSYNYVQQFKPLHCLCINRFQTYLCIKHTCRSPDCGPVHKRTNHVPKYISECDSALSWFESMILPFVNAKLFQIRLLKHVLKCEKKGVLDRDPRRKPDSRTCERKALSERDSCVCILEVRAEAMHG